MFRALVLCGLLFCSVMAVASTPGSDALSTSSTVVVKQENPIATITLPSNPTTGYTWFYQPTGTAGLVEQVSSHYDAPKEGRMGQGGMTTFTLSLKKDAFDVPTVIPVTFIYARAWDMQTATKKTVYVVAVSS